MIREVNFIQVFPLCMALVFDLLTGITYINEMWKLQHKDRNIESDGSVHFCGLNVLSNSVLSLLFSLFNKSAERTVCPTQLKQFRHRLSGSKNNSPSWQVITVLQIYETVLT
jgi:hypothetical protein